MKPSTTSACSWPTLSTAIQTIFPGALQRTQTLLTAISLPPIGVLTGSLINELDELERDFIVVLEDYHAIHKQEIHDLLTALLQPPAKHMHLVLITRKDPPLPQSVLLARNQMAEVRLHDLRFSADEIAAFMRNALESPLPDEAIAALAEKTEGWITSLRLAALALRHSPDADSRVAELRGSGAQPQSDRLPDERGARADSARHRGFSPEDRDPRPDVRPVVRSPARAR